MQKTIILSLALVFAITGVFAQGSTTVKQTATTEGRATLSPAEKAKKAADKITAAVQLTAEQAGKIVPFLEEYYNKLDAAKKANTDPKSKGLAVVKKSLNEVLFSKLQTVLSADQVAKVKDMYNNQHSAK